MNKRGFPIENQPMLAQRSFAFVSLCLALIAGITWQSGLNLALFDQINTFCQQFIHDHLLILVTEFGNGTLLIVLLLLISIAQPGFSKRMLIAILLSALSIYGLKSGFSLPRPPVVLGADMIHIVGEPVRSDSFPSGHSATAFMIAGLLWLSFSTGPIRWLWVVLASLVALSRVGIGAHWPQDIAAGSLLGWVTAWFASQLSLVAFKEKANFSSGLFLSLIACIAVFTTPVEFKEYPAVQYVRVGFGVLSGLFSLYFILRLSMLRPAIGQWVERKIDWAKDYQNWLPMRFSKFGLVGFTGFLVDTLVYKSVMVAGLPHLVARAISYWVSASTNWYLNRSFTFNDAEFEEKSSQWVKYLAMCAGSFVLNYGSYYLLTEAYGIFDGDYKFIAFLIGIAMGVVFNFGVANWVIFKRDRKDWLS